MAQAKAGSTEPIYACFSDDVGQPVTGLTATVRICCIGGTNDGKFYSTADGGTWVASPADEPTMTEVDSTNMPGVYVYNWPVPSGEYVGDGVSYAVRIDGSDELAAPQRYQFESITPATADAADLALITSILANKQEHIRDVNTGMTQWVKTYAADGTTVVHQAGLEISSDGATETRTNEAV